MKDFVFSIFLSLFSFIIPLSPIAAQAASLEGIPSQREANQGEQVRPAVILGGGVGALTSALYLSRAGIEPFVIQGPTPGGLLTQSHSVQNWPGEMEIDGISLTEKMRSQAAANGTVLLEEEVTAVDFSKRPFTINTRSLLDGKEREIKSESVIIAMGTQPNFLGVPGETGKDGYWGKGVTNCAICDGSLYRDKIVGVVGGGDAAVLEALYLSNIAKEVHVFVRKDSFKAIEEKRAETLVNKPNVKIHYKTSVIEIKGDGEKLSHVVLKEETRTPYNFSLDGLFLAIGSTPNSGIFKKSLELDQKGYILLKKDQQTSIEGVYAIGDIVDPVYKQAISAAGDGAKAALQAQQYISDRANRLAGKNKPRPQNQNVNDAAENLLANKHLKPIRAAESQNLPLLSQAADSLNQVIEIASQEQFDKELQSSDVPVVVDFYATWCGPCKRISPMIESSANQLVGKVKFLKVNVDQLSDLSTTYNIRAMPTVLVLDPSGKVSDRKVGTKEISDLLKQLEASLH